MKVHSLETTGKPCVRALLTHGEAADAPKRP